MYVCRVVRGSGSRILTLVRMMIMVIVVMVTRHQRRKQCNNEQCKDEASSGSEPRGEKYY